GMDIEILNWVVRVSMPEKPTDPMVETSELQGVAIDRKQTIHCDLDGVPKEAALVERADLQPGNMLDGPALITEPQTTTLVSSDFSAHVDPAGNLVLTQKRAGAET
ncbi:MAG: hypothetical protein ACR2PF_10300, partial [Rhizobiaceae bacterium]